MKLVIDRRLLIKAMALVVEAADSRHRLAILANLKLVLSSDTLILTASDLEVQLSCCITLPPEACVQAGTTTLPAEKFFSICRLLSDDLVDIEVDEQQNRCNISSGKGRYVLSTLSAQDYPSIGEPVGDKCIKVAPDAFSDVLKHTRFAMATQDVRHYLTGLLLEVEHQKLTAVATDGHRLAVAYRALQASYPATKIIIPNKAVSGLERLLLELGKAADKENEIDLRLDDEFLQITLNFGQQMSVNLTARLIEGKFPDYRRVLPTNNDKIALFSKDEMVSVLRRISVLNTKESPGVSLNFADGEFAIISSSNREQDEATETLAVKYTGEPIEIAFNESYLRAVLNVLEGDVYLKMIHPNSPALIYQADDDTNHQYVVMPMRV